MKMTRTDAGSVQSIAPAATAAGAPDGASGPAQVDHMMAINAESRTYWEGEELVSILSVHTLVCPLIRAELRGVERVRVLAYYHTSTRLGLQAYEVLLRDEIEVRERLGLRRFVRDTLGLPATEANLHDPVVREMYLHEVIRRRAHAIAACQLETDDEFLVAQII